MLRHGGHRSRAPRRVGKNEGEEAGGSSLFIPILLGVTVLFICTGCVYLARGHTDAQLEHITKSLKVTSAMHVESVDNLMKRVNGEWSEIAHNLVSMRNSTAIAVEEVHWMRGVLGKLKASNDKLQVEKDKRSEELGVANVAALKLAQEAPNAGVADIVRNFVDSVDSDDLKPVFIPPLVAGQDTMAINLRSFAETGNCDVIAGMVGYTPSNTTDGVHLVVQYPVLDTIGSDNEDDSLLLGRFFGAYQDKDEDMPARIELMHAIERFEAKDYQHLAEAWLEKGGMPINKDLARCFGSQMMIREQEKKKRDLVLWELDDNGQQSHQEITTNCPMGDAGPIDRLQQMADLLVKPNRKTYMWWGPDQLRFYARRKAQDRAKEFEDVLRWNICHPGVKQVHLLVESEAHNALAQQKTSTYQGGGKVVRRVISRRMQYQDAWAYSGELHGNVVVTNSDVVIGEGLHMLTNTTLSGRAYALSRHEAVTSTLASHVCCSGSYDGCHDSFMLQAPPPAALAPATNFQQNVWQAENVMIMELCRVALHVTNPCSSIKLYHYHNSNFRPAQNRAHMDREWKMCHPSEGLNQGGDCCFARRRS